MIRVDRLEHDIREEMNNLDPLEQLFIKLIREEKRRDEQLFIKLIIKCHFIIKKLVYVLIYLC